MDVIKIQRLSKQHKSLKDFHEACNHNDVELVAKKPANSFGDVTLNNYTAKSILIKLRGILLDRIAAIEAAIKEEVTSG